jgi:hypothetical protein
MSSAHVSRRDRHARDAARSDERVRLANEAPACWLLLCAEAPLSPILPVAHQSDTQLAG